MAVTSLTYLAIGGTAALSVEPLLHLCAAGLGPPSLSILIVDSDGANPAVQRALALIDQYAKVRSAFGEPQEGFFRTHVSPTAEHDVHWSPIGIENPGAEGGRTTLQTFVERVRMTGGLAEARLLLDLLFSKRQQEEELKEGFRGNPSIGSILMTGLKDAPQLKRLRQGQVNHTGKAYFAVGSVFGGTGAAGLPVVANLLLPERQEGESDDAFSRRVEEFRTRLGAALITPYFSLPLPSGSEASDGRLKPDSGKFLRATRAALPTYTKHRTRYGRVYVLGDDFSLREVRPLYSAGGRQQKNDPHTVELFAAMAALHFVRASTPEPQAGTDFFYTRVTGKQPSWSDLPLTPEQKKDLEAFLVSSNFFLHYFGRERDHADQGRIASELKTQPWLAELDLAPEFVRSRGTELNLLGSYFAEAWGYLHALHHAPRGEQTRVDLVRFEPTSGACVRTPTSYSISDTTSTFPLARVHSTLPAFAVSRAAGAELLHDVEMFHWFNRVRDPSQKGLPGLLHYLRHAGEAYVASATSGPTR